MPEPGAPAGLVWRLRRVPERIIGRCTGLGHHRGGVDVVVLPVEVTSGTPGPGPSQDLEGLVEAGLRLGAGHAVEAGLDRGDAPAHAEDEPAAGELVERGRLFDHPQRGNSGRIEISVPSRIVEVQLGRGGQHQVRGGDAEGGAVVLGELVGVVAEPLVGRDQFEALVQLPCRWQAGRVVVIEDGEEHRQSLPDGGHGAGQAEPRMRSGSSSALSSGCLADGHQRKATRVVLCHADPSRTSHRARRVKRAKRCECAVSAGAAASLRAAVSRRTGNAAVSSAPASAERHRGRRRQRDGTDRAGGRPASPADRVRDAGLRPADAGPAGRAAVPGRRRRPTSPGRPPQTALASTTSGPCCFRPTTTGPPRSPRRRPPCRRWRGRHPRRPLPHRRQPGGRRDPAADRAGVRHDAVRARPGHLDDEHAADAQAQTWGSRAARGGRQP